jgi:hypothetical protein
MLTQAVAASDILNRFTTLELRAENFNRFMGIARDWTIIVQMA